MDTRVDPTQQTQVAPEETEITQLPVHTQLMTDEESMRIGRPLRPAPVEHVEHVEQGEDEPDELMPGEFIGRYVILDVLGKGGMGVVYSAYDSDLHRQLAIKLLRRIKMGSRATEGHQRLVREAQALAGLSHPNVITVHDVGEHEGQVFVAMELVEGVTLREYCKESSRGWEEVFDAFIQAGRGLAAAHAAGLIHRDFKPENVLVGNDGRVRVLDFGLARASNHVSVTEERDGYSAPAPSDSGSGRASRPGSSSLTKTGAIMGTPAYMSPEQHLGMPTDPRTDQFSFCIALFEGLAGRRPFTGATAVAIAESVLRGSPEGPPRGLDVPSNVWKIVSRGFSREVEDRWPSMDALLEALEETRNPDAPNRLPLIAGAVAIAAFASAIVFGSEPEVAATASLDCSGAAASVEDAWNAQRGESLEKAFAALGGAPAAEAGQRTRAALDKYASSLSEALRSNCQARARAPEEDADLLHHSACLQERSDELAMLVAALSEPTPESVQSAVPAALSLTAVERCADPSRVPLVEAPSDEIRGVVTQHRRALASAAGLRRSGRFDDAKAALREVVVACREVGYPPLLADALLEQGRALAATGDGKAESVLREAVRHAELARHDVAVIEAATELVEVVGLQAAHHDQGQLWAERAADILARVPSEPRLTARLAMVRGRLELSAGDVNAAMKSQLDALEAAKAIEPADPLRIAQARSHLGDVQTEAGEYDAAIESFSQALIELESQLGAEHPGLARTLNGLGNVYDALGRLPHALGQYQRALDLREAAFGAEHPEVAGTRVNLARVLVEMGELDEAREQLEAARRAFEAAFGPDHPGVGLALEALSRLEEREGQLDRALAQVERALAIQEANAPADHPHRAALLTRLGTLLHRQGEGSRAIAKLEQANAILDADSSPAAVRAEAKLALAQVLSAEEVDRKRARALALEARKLLVGLRGGKGRGVEAIDAFLREL